jgi:hypothetical protein
MWSASEDLLLRFQATSSGPILREEFEARKSFLGEQVGNVVKIQVCEPSATDYRKLSCSAKKNFDLKVGQSTTSIPVNSSDCRLFPLPDPLTYFSEALRWGSILTRSAFSSGLLESIRQHVDLLSSTCLTGAKGTAQIRVEITFL